MALFSITHPKTVLLISLLLAGGSGVYSYDRLYLNQDPLVMLGKETKIRLDSEYHEGNFSFTHHVTVLAIEGKNRHNVQKKAFILAQILNKDESGFILDVFYPPKESFIVDNSLLYASKEELTSLLQSLYDNQILMGYIWADPTVRGLFDNIRMAKENPGQLSREQRKKMLTFENLLALAIDEAQEGNITTDPWAPLFPTGQEQDLEDSATEILLIKGKLEYEKLAPERAYILYLKKILLTLGLTPDKGYQVYMTGLDPLSYEERIGISKDVTWAGLFSLIAIVIFMLVGTRSVRAGFLILLSLGFCMFLSLGWATLSVGYLNVITSAFFIFVMGLGADYFIHNYFRYQEHLNDSNSPADAIAKVVENGSGAMFICLLSTVIAFLSLLIPKHFLGGSELGLMASGGMIICFFSAYTVLPAFLCLFKITPPKKKKNQRNYHVQYVNFIVKNRLLILTTWTIMLCVFIFLGADAFFQPSIIRMKDQSSSSVQAYRHLSQKQDTIMVAPYFVLPKDADYDTIKKRLEGLSSVKKVQGIKDFIPEDQEDKLSIIATMRALISPLFTSHVNATVDTLPQKKEALERLITVLEEEDLPSPLLSSLKNLEENPARSDILRIIAQDIIGSYEDRVFALTHALQADKAFTKKELPSSIIDYFYGQDGREQFVVYPAENIEYVSALRTFIGQLEEAVPSAIIVGLPQSENQLSKIVIKFAWLSMTGTIIIITLLLLVIFRSFYDTLITLLPLITAELFLAAFNSFEYWGFTYTSVIILPLIFGLGADSGIHIVKRYMESHSLEKALSSTTPRAILLSSFTTFAAVGSLAFSGHQALHSMGLAMMLALIILILCTCLGVPAIFATYRRELKDNH